MNPKLVAIAKAAGVPLGFVAATVILFGYLLPFDAIKIRVEAGYNANPANVRAGKTLRIEELSSWWRLGAKATNVSLITGGNIKSATVLDVVRVRPELLSLLLFRSSASVNIDAFGGSITGSASREANDFHFEDVDLSLIGAVKEGACGIPMTGKVSGDVTLAMPGGAMDKANGAVHLVITGLSLSDGKTAGKCAGPPATTVPTLPKMTIGTLNVDADIKDGKLKWTKLAATGSDISLKGEGNLTFRPKLEDSTLDTLLTFKFADALVARDESTKALFDSRIGVLWMMSPDIKKARQEDGSVMFKLGGNFARPSFSPAGTPAAAPVLARPRMVPEPDDDKDDAP